MTSKVKVCPASKSTAWTWNLQTCGSSLVTGFGSAAPSCSFTVLLSWWPPDVAEAPPGDDAEATPTAPRRATNSAVATAAASHRRLLEPRRD
jgi:hypothetical protein